MQTLEEPAAQKVVLHKGQIGIFFLMAITLAIVIVLALGTDGMRVHQARQELQRAVDAAALAGALDLFSSPDTCLSHAMATAEKNKCDGKPVSNETPGTKVDGKVELPQGTFLGRVTVTSEKAISHMFLPIIGRNVDTIRARAVAGPVGAAQRLPENKAFPLAVSWDCRPKDESQPIPALKDMQIGDSFIMYVGSQKVKNAAFTSFLEPAASASYINQAISQSLGLVSEQPGFIPSIKVGDDIELNNGIVGQKQLAGSPYRESLLNEPYVILPVITGDSPFNQSREVIGFVGMKITDLKVNQKHGIVETITATLVKVAIGTPDPGEPGPPPVGELSALSIKLLE